MPDQAYRGDDVLSCAHIKTREGDLLVSLHHTGRMADRSVDLKISALGSDQIFDWPMWRGTMAGEDGPNDTATLRFRGTEPVDALVYGLWKTADQLFRHGRGLSVDELRLNIAQLTTLFPMVPPIFRVVALRRDMTSIRMVMLKKINDAPAMALRLLEEYHGEDDLLCAALRITFPKTKTIQFHAIYGPSVDTEEREAAISRVKKRGGSIHDFYLDHVTERLLLEVALWQVTEALRRHFAEEGPNRDPEVIRSLHAQLRKLTLMHDTSTHAQELQMQDYVNAYPHIDFNKS